MGSHDSTSGALAWGFLAVMGISDHAFFDFLRTVIDRPRLIADCSNLCSHLLCRGDRNLPNISSARDIVVLRTWRKASS